jgi:hypothetical protein
MRFITPFFYLIIVMILAFGNSSAHADIYTWPNGENNRHYTNSPPPLGSENVELFLKCAPPRPEVPDQPVEEVKISSINEKENLEESTSMEADSDVEPPERIPQKMDPGTDFSYEATE